MTELELNRDLKQVLAVHDDSSTSDSVYVKFFALPRLSLSLTS